MDMNNKRNRRIKILDDNYNEIIWKPNTNRVVVGINIGSYHKSKYRGITCHSLEEAKKVGIDYINKHSKIKVTAKKIKP